VPSPESTRKIQLLCEIGPGLANCPVENRIKDKLISTMMVRMKVARSGLMSSTPTFAKIAVNAANIADSTAQTCQEDRVSGFMRVLYWKNGRRSGPRA
jgi:hypothetical protein